MRKAMFFMVLLLTAQHHGCNLRSIGQIVDAGLYHLDTSEGESFVKFLLQLLVDLIGTRAQRGLPSLRVLIVVGILSCYLTESCIALYTYEVL